MDEATREHLRIIIAVALGLTPRRVKRDLAERLTFKCDPAKRIISEAIVAEIERQFRVERRAESPTGISPHSRMIPPDAEC